MTNTVAWGNIRCMSEQTGSQWFTYHEAGAILGIGAESVKRRAQRGSLPRQIGPDGRARVSLGDPSLAVSDDVPRQPFHAVAQKLRAVFWPDNTCAYCRGEASQLDHVTPRALGGTDDPWNLIPACRPCNLAKNTKLAERFAGLRALHRIRLFCEAARLLSDDVR